MSDQPVDPITAVIRLGLPFAEKGAALVERFLGPVTDAGGKSLAERIAVRQWKYRLKVAAQAAELIEQNSDATKIPPPEFLLPLIEAAGNAADETLQEMWARLLASSCVDEQNQHPMFIDAVKKLSPQDALLLSEIALRTDRYRQISPYSEGDANAGRIPRHWCSEGASRLDAIGLIDAAEINSLPVGTHSPYAMQIMGPYANIVTVGNYRAAPTPFGELLIAALGLRTNQRRDELLQRIRESRESK